MLVLSLAIGVPGIAKSNSTEVIVWQIGFPHGEVNPDVDPIVGSSEYPADDEEPKFVWQFNYTIGDDADSINAPSIPGYLAPPPNNVCDIAQDDRPCTDTTIQIDINFTLDCDYEDDELTLIYGRFGLEADDIFLNEIWLGQVSGTAGKYDKFEFSLKKEDLDLVSGENEISIVLAPPWG